MARHTGHAELLREAVDGLVGEDLSGWLAHQDRPISPEHLNVGTRGDYMQPCLQQRDILADVLTRLRDAVASACAAAAGCTRHLDGRRAHRRRSVRARTAGEIALRCADGLFGAG